jgi:hypothetical protein
VEEEDVEMRKKGADEEVEERTTCLQQRAAACEEIDIMTDWVFLNERKEERKIIVQEELDLEHQLSFFPELLMPELLF